ncbi:MAG TPA: hypothetical protein VFS11_00755 [Gemmatimonadales bacterium]|nr:hypothetical protein [Gemmatimonadales bacterium]
MLPGQLRASAAGPIAWAQAHQDTSTATYDTSATGKKSKTQGKHHGAATDTALRAKPGVQTGPTDSAKKQRSSQGMADSMKDSTP